MSADHDGEIRTTYVGGLASADVADEDLVLGVVRYEYDFVGRSVDRNVPALAPPEELLDAYNAIREAAAKDESIPDTDDEARRVAWDGVSFRERYLNYLDRAGPQEVLGTLRDRLDDDRDVWLVCLEANEAFCHRRLLAARVVDEEPAHFSEIYGPPEVEQDPQVTLDDFDGGESA
ncbi:DUF488 family protein, N3 subclade [Halolamina salifodinae]|uniref:DUF488 domain-containing protein n=1 Tax=Halolamina salifodinae TaxID=1202767 RepID=A0A8T4GS11_9EURY|nr:DUF488 family protein [Halolamina salifodinae]MBP1985931.1 hypothetical protein [Halolamina salifodinae]